MDGASRWPVLLLGLAATVPSLAWGLLGADYLSDDLWVALGFVRRGVVDGAIELSFVGPARPLVGPYYVLTHYIIGERFLLQAIVMALLNAGLVVGLWAALRTIVTEQTALLATLVFAVVPNRASTRLWFAVGPNVLALTCVVVGAFLLVRKGKALPAAGLFVSAVLFHEGVAGVAGVIVLWWWLGDRRNRTRGAALAAVPLVVAVGAAWVVSPKRAGNSPGPFHNVSTIGPAQLGSGFWGSEVAGLAGGMVILAAITWSLAAQLPSFRRPGSPLPREVLTGACLLVAGAAPFVVGGAPFAVRGIFDRNNMVPDVGSCLVVGALLAAAIRGRKGPGRAVTTAVVVLLAAGNLQDISDYRRAADEGHALVEALLAEVDPSIGDVVVVPTVPQDTGVAQFILDGDLTAALRLRHGPAWASTSMPLRTPDCGVLAQRAAATPGRPTFVYHRIDRVLRPASHTEACSDR